MFTGIIYKWTNMVNGKVYIGQTMNPEQRRNQFMRKNSFYTSDGSKIDRARAKYGVDAFTYSVVMEIQCEDKDELTAQLNQLEVKYIMEYDSLNNGYNTIKGGTNYNHPEHLDRIAAYKNKCPVQVKLNQAVQIPIRIFEILSPIESYVYAVLKLSTSKYISFRQITSMTGLAVKTIMKSTKLLEKAGFLKIVKSPHIKSLAYDIVDFTPTLSITKDFLLSDSFLGREKAFILSLYSIVKHIENGLGVIPLYGKDIAANLKVSESTVSRTLKRLIQYEVISLVSDTYSGHPGFYLNLKKCELEIPDIMKTGSEIVKENDAELAILYKLGEHDEQINQNTEDIEGMKKEIALLREELAQYKRNFCMF